MVAAKGQVLDAVAAAANIGNDTDTIATMIGAILGAMHGIQAFPEEIVRTIDEANDYHLQELAEVMADTNITIE